MIRLLMMTVIPCFLIFISDFQSVAEEPSEAVVYTNQVGNYQNTFVLAPKGQVSGCRYKIWLNGVVSDVQLDRLTYVRDVEFADGRAESPPVVRGWLYKGFDKTGNSWELIFGKEENTRPGTFSVYFRFPGSAGFTRWLTDGGTQRRAASFDDQVLAILWANQVEVDQLALHPFERSQLDPLVPMLIWTALKPELENFLKSQGATFLTVRPTKLQNGKFQVDLHVTEEGTNVQARLFRVLQNTDDLDLVTVEVHATFTADVSQISTEFLANGQIQLPRVASSMTETIERDAPILASMNLGSSQKIADSSCEVSTGRWTLLSRGDMRSYFWKIKLKFELLDASGQRFKISSLVDIGQCLTSQIALGESKITPLIADMEDFKAFANTALDSPDASPSKMPRTNPPRINVRSNPDNVEILQPTLEGTGLDMLFDECFETWLRKLAKK